MTTDRQQGWLLQHLKETMFDDALIQQLAQELNQSEKSRVQIEHFSKRFPGMTIEDGYRINRAWMQI